MGQPLTNERLAVLLREEGWRVWNADSEKRDESEHEDEYDIVLFKQWINCRDAGKEILPSLGNAGADF